MIDHYTIRKSDLIADYVVNQEDINTETNITLIGYNYFKFGEVLQQNELNLATNFYSLCAGKSANEITAIKTKMIPGQILYDGTDLWLKKNTSLVKLDLTTIISTPQSGGGTPSPSPTSHDINNIAQDDTSVTLTISLADMLHSPGAVVNWSAGQSITIVSSNASQAVISTNWVHLHSVNWVTPGNAGAYGDNLLCTVDGVTHTMTITHHWPA